MYSVYIVLIACHVIGMVCVPLSRVFNDNQSDLYKAAVYEHVPVKFHGGGLIKPTIKQAKKVISENLEIYQEQAKIASAQGVQIIVFPEYGLWGLDNILRDNIQPFLETIPDPVETDWNPCNEANSHSLKYTAQIGLSCIAQHYGLYVAANMGDIQYCDRDTDPYCPRDGRYQYNANVVFNPDGKLVSRYHKETLYYEYFYDEPLEVQHSVFETPFGRFGSMVCFDVLFKEPGVGLVEDYQVDSVIFPTAWSSKLPLMQGLGFHEAWAHLMGVNMLSSELHEPSGYFTGSGIYSGADGAKAQYLHLEFDNPQPKLLIAEVPIHPRRYQTGYISSLPPPTEGLDLFYSGLQSDNYTFAVLNNNEDNITISLGEGATCNLVYQFSDRHPNEMYGLGMYDGIHYSAHNSYIQVCVLLKCADINDRTTCGDYIYDSESKFNVMELTGQFQTNYIYPELVVNGGFVDKSVWEYQDDIDSSKGILKLTQQMEKSLLVAGLYGRKYEWDTLEDNI